MDDDRVASLVFLVGAIVTGAVLFSIVRGFTFLQDEWAYIGSRREFGLQTLLRPYNEHWQSIPILIYQIVFRLRGLSSYGSLAAAAALAHLLAATMLFALLRRHAHPLLALGGALGLLLFAWSDEVLLWPAIMVFSLPVGFGLAAILAWDRDRSSWRMDALGAVAMTAGLASGGVALVFLVVASAFLLARRPSPSRVFWPAACFVIYLAWFLAFGAAGIRRGAGIDIITLPPFVASGLAALAAPLLGLDYRFRLVSIVVLAAAVGGAIGWLRPRELRIWIPLIGVIVVFALIGTARAGNAEPEGAQAPRYMYPAATLAFLAIIPLIDAVRRTIGGNARRLLWLGFAAWFVLAIAGDIGKLVRSAEAYAERAGQIRAEMRAVQVLRPVLAGTPASSIVIDRHFFGGMTPSAYYAAIDDLTAPVSKATAGSLLALAPQHRQDVDRLIEHLLHAGLVPRISASAPGVLEEGVAGRLKGLHDAALEGAGAGCATLRVTGADPFFSLQTVAGERVWIRTDGQRVLQVFARVVGDRFEHPASSFYPLSESWYEFEPEPLPPGLAWTLRVDPPPGSSSFDICLLAGNPGPG